MAEAEDALWQDLDACTGVHTDPAQPDLSGAEASTRRLLASPPTNAKLMRACLDTPFAPHNVEGFFWQFGDLLTKRGRTEVAKRMYGLAEAAPGYASWSLRSTYEAQRALVDRRAAAFARAARVEDEPPLYARSAYFCVSCHAR